MSEFWRMSPMYSTAPDLADTGIGWAPMLYCARENRPHPFMPHLNCLVPDAGKAEAFAFKPTAVESMAASLAHLGATSVVWDYEPIDDANPHTPDARRCAEYTVDAFEAAGVTLDVWGADVSEVTDWIDRTNGGTNLYADWYAHVSDPKEWEAVRVRSAAEIRKRYPGRKLYAYVCPISDGRGTSPPAGQELPADLWGRMLKVIEDVCDGGRVWVGRMKPDGSGYLPWAVDRDSRWFKMLKAAAKN